MSDSTAAMMPTHFMNDFSGEDVVVHVLSGAVHPAMLDGPGRGKSPRAGRAGTPQLSRSRSAPARAMTTSAIANARRGSRALSRYPSQLPR